jgi:hypothetical protein
MFPGVGHIDDGEVGQPPQSVGPGRLREPYSDPADESYSLPPDVHRQAGRRDDMCTGQQEAGRDPDPAAAVVD